MKTFSGRILFSPEADMMDAYTYLLIDLGTISIPLLCSFEHRIRFYKKWPGLFLGITITAVIFILWDIAFTSMGVWGFNPRYLTGINVVNLPIEEWLFFFAIPYACMFIYESMNWIIKRDLLGKVANKIGLALAAVLLIIGLLNLDKWYTAVTFISTSAFLATLILYLKPTYLGRFFVGYGISLIPFFVVNGLLTGSWIPDQVVWYNDAENLGIRMGTIPVEDSMYMLLMLLMTTSIYESWKSRKRLLT